MSADFAELHRQVVFGKSNGRIIWQPRIGCWISDKRFAGQKLPPPYEGMTLPQIYRELGCSARIYEYNSCFRCIEHPSVARRQRPLNATDTEITTETPAGRQVEVLRKSPNSPRQIHVKWEITTEEEMKVAVWRAENTTWKWDQAKFIALRAEWGDVGAPTMYLPRINIQDLFINRMGVENAVYALHDWPDTVRAYFRALDECHHRLIQVVNASPIDIINFGDNVHCATCSPDLFCRHVLPAYQSRCAKLHGAGKFVCAHWDGDTKSLLPLARTTGLDGIEAITPQPQGDVTLEEVKAGLGDSLVLIDGLPAIFFDTYYPVSVLEDFTHRLIEMFAPGLVLGISDELSSTGDIERIRLVGKIVEQYNQSAMRDS